MRKKLMALLVLSMMLTLLVAAPAFAYHCTNVNKKAGAGSIGTYNVVTETFTSSGKKGGGFVTVTDGVHTYDIFYHNMLPEGALAAGPGGDDHCDGRGVDDVFACLGIPH